MSIFAVGYNQLSGRLPTRCSPTIKALLFQHNTRIVGALPMELSSFSAIGVCGTGMCPSTTLPFQYCLPSEVMFSSQDQSDLLRLASPFQEVCDPKAVVNLRPSRTTTPILSPVHDVAGFPTGASSELLPAMLVISLATGTGGVGLARGAVPSLQRSSSALRAMSQCVAPGEESDEAPPPYSALEDNPLALPITMRGSGDLDGAVSAGVGNGLLVGIIGIVLHMVAVMQQWSSRLTSKGPLLRFMCRIVKALPSSLLPGSFAVTYGTLLQPSVGACVSLIASENRSLASVICGVLLLCVWCSLPAYCLFAVVWRGRRSTHDGKFALECIACAPSARVTRGRQQMQLKERWLALVAHIAEPTHQWTVRSRSGATKATTDFLSENMEAVFGGYVREREWFFIVQWTTAMISGIMQGALETAGTDDPTLACPTAYASCAVAMVFTAGDVITTLWLQPLSARLEMWGGVGVSVLSILSQILVLSDAPQSAGIAISTAAILELLVMTFLMLQVAFVSLRSSGAEKRNTIHNNQVNLRNMQLGRPLARMGEAQQPQQQHHAQVELDVTGHADVQLMLKRLVTMACNDQQSRRWML
ncbi:GP46-like surface antigen, putative [Bodo saltans]|uniref:GP46-like surface antigen, putative n=1 Tax=Bodo saltans TaxID=75058 RepID=A0A0S4JLM8_BODSA|nr:GP46-like surface antigen, putative [Bodo saltans]|eukprot:CUG91082.1 GP46-like surface antigen, putative [Bodo saltans]